MTVLPAQLWMTMLVSWPALLVVSLVGVGCFRLAARLMWGGGVEITPTQLHDEESSP